MLTPIVGVGINVGGSAHEAQADLTVRVPHPTTSRPSPAPDAQTDIPMQRIERSLNVQVMLVALRTPHFRLRAFGGPSYFRIEQDSVTDIVYNQFYFVHSPGNVAELTEYQYSGSPARGGASTPARTARCSSPASSASAGSRSTAAAPSTWRTPSPGPWASTRRSASRPAECRSAADSG